MNLLFATSNPHKIEEVFAILAPLGVVISGLDELEQTIPPPEETEATFAGNARLKARHYARVSGRACLADDSGLEVDALDGEPGVRSARYAGLGETRGERDAANNALLLYRMREVPEEERTARFICAMALALPDGGILIEAEGAFEGRITEAPRGGNGFGYDPLLELIGENRTAAELTPEEKNARSHRGEAARKIAAGLPTESLAQTFRQAGPLTANSDAETHPQT